MKINLLLLSLSLSTVFTINGYGQNDYATIVVYRPSKFVMSAVKVSVFINGSDVATLANGGKVEYKLFGTGSTVIKVWGVSSYNTKVSTINVNTQNGNTYYFKVEGKSPFTGGYFELEQTDKLKQSGSLKKKKFVTGSDLAVSPGESLTNLQGTGWTKDKLKEHWAKNGAQDIEGIYEKVGSGIQYELAVVKEDNEYKIIYLSGASGTNWTEGDLKAKLEKTANFGIFKCDWYMINRVLAQDELVIFEKSIMTTRSETQSKSGQSKYLKVYPTYDESSVPQGNPNAGWKGTGTGFFIDVNGYVVTNYHVIEVGSTFEVNITKNGNTTPYKAKVVSQDKQNDLAILKIEDENFTPFTKLQYNFDTQIKDVGSSVFALGYPLTSVMGTEIKFTDGKISAKSGYQGDITTYQISVPIQSGNSGGPLFDEKGNLVGITSSGLNKQIADNANYAIKTSYLKLLVDATDDKLSLPSNEGLTDLPLTEQIKVLSEYVVLIRVK